MTKSDRQSSAAMPTVHGRALLSLASKAKSITRPAAIFALRYGLALVSVAVAFGLAYTFLSFHLPQPFTAFALSAIAITFWYGGAKPGILAAVLSSVVRDYFFEPDTVIVSRVLYSFVFVLFAVVMIRVVRARDELEVRVAERTADLTKANAGLKLEIAERKRAEMLLAGEKRLLEMIARGDSRAVILDALCRLVEELASGSLSSILLLDPKANCLRHGAAPSLPMSYMEAIDGIVIGPSTGSCGTAAYRAEPVIVSDVATDPLWADYRDLALAHGLRACWSRPILSSEGKVLGTFATYYREPRNPTPHEHNVVEQVSQLASIAVEHEQSEEALRQAQADLAHGNRVTTMGELTASLAHEVNQPITAALTNATTCLHWLASDTPNLEKARAAAMRMVKDGTRAAEIISRIRLLFKKGAPEWELVDVNEVIREMTILLRGEVTRYSISVRTALAADLPKGMGDRVQLQQVMMNLIMNSIDAMKELDGTRELVIRSHRIENEQLMVSISDTGVGLPVQQADQIFNAFVTTKPDGTGMGLSISRSIVESHGGRLWATDNAPRGASFHFILPTKVGAPSLDVLEGVHH